jgi:thiosulfate/3-mercaptopyruvate sulfurtransferase
VQVYSYFEAEMQPQLRTTLEDLQQLPQLATQPDPFHQQQQQQQDPQQQQHQHGVLFLDTRNKQQYMGQVRRGPRGGYIPGAVSLPRAELLEQETELFKSLEQQQQLLQQAGVVLPGGSSAAAADSQQRVVVYCNGGVAACTAALALHRLGHRNWAVYDGSWNEYSNTQLPVAKPQ